MNSKKLPLQTAAGALAAATLIGAMPHPHPVDDLSATRLRPPMAPHPDETELDPVDRGLPALTVKEVRPVGTPFDNEAMFPPPRDWPWMPQILPSTMPLTLMMSGMGGGKDELPVAPAHRTSEERGDA
jgi:hypothetical protein